MAAIANAIERATGRRLTELPMSPPKVLAAIDARGQGGVTLTVNDGRGSAAFAGLYMASSTLDFIVARSHPGSLPQGASRSRLDPAIHHCRPRNEARRSRRRGHQRALSHDEGRAPR